MTDDLHIPQDDLVLHAMQALSYQEAEPLREHLASCAECRGRLAAANGNLALVSLSVARKPVPEGARQRFMQKLATTGAAGGFRPSPVVPIYQPPTRRSSALPWLAAAALLLLAAGLGFQVMSLNGKLRAESDRAAQLAATNADLTAKNAHAHEVLELMTAPHAQRAVLTASSRPVPMGRAVYLAESGALIFQCSNLAHLPENKTYELWLIPANGHAPMPAGMFRPDAAGNASVMMPPLPKGVMAKAFGVTVEKAGGSDAPTMPIVLSGAATSAGE